MATPLERWLTTQGDKHQIARNFRKRVGDTRSALLLEPSPPPLCFAPFFPVANAYVYMDWNLTSKGVVFTDRPLVTDEHGFLHALPKGQDVLPALPAAGRSDSDWKKVKEARKKLLVRWLPTLRDEGKRPDTAILVEPIAKGALKRIEERKKKVLQSAEKGEAIADHDENDLRLLKGMSFIIHRFQVRYRGGGKSWMLPMIPIKWRRELDPHHAVREVEAAYRLLWKKEDAFKRKIKRNFEAALTSPNPDDGDQQRALVMIHGAELAAWLKGYEVDKDLWIVSKNIPLYDHDRADWFRHMFEKVVPAMLEDYAKDIDFRQKRLSRLLQDKKVRQALARCPQRVHSHVDDKVLELHPDELKSGRWSKVISNDVHQRVSKIAGSEVGHYGYQLTHCALQLILSNADDKARKRLYDDFLKPLGSSKSSGPLHDVMEGAMQGEVLAGAKVGVAHAKPAASASKLISLALTHPQVIFVDELDDQKAVKACFALYKHLLGNWKVIDPVKFDAGTWSDIVSRGRPAKEVEAFLDKAVKSDIKDTARSLKLLDTIGNAVTLTSGVVTLLTIAKQQKKEGKDYVKGTKAVFDVMRGTHGLVVTRLPDKLATKFESSLAKTSAAMSALKLGGQGINVCLALNDLYDRPEHDNKNRLILDGLIYTGHTIALAGLYWDASIVGAPVGIIMNITGEVIALSATAAKWWYERTTDEEKFLIARGLLKPK